MKMYLIESLEGWGYDEYDCHLVRAMSEKQARAICPNADEGEGRWLDKKRSSCRWVRIFGEKEVIISSFNAG